MATSGTSAFNATRGDLIRSALIDVGLIGADDSEISSRLHDEAARRLDGLIKSLDGKGAKLYQIQRLTLNSVAGQQAYVLPESVWDVDQPARYTPSGTTTAIPLYPMARRQWMITTDRTMQGTPVQYYIEKSLDASGLQICTMYLYLIPNVTGDTIEYAAIMKSQDSGTDANTPYFSQKWLRALRLGLAAECAPMARTSDRPFRDAFDAEYQDQLNSDVEIADVQEVPFGNYWYGYRYP